MINARGDLAKPMSVEFDEELKFNDSFRKFSPESSSGLANWLIKNGIAKDEVAAKNIMILISIICFSLAIYFLFN